MEANFDLDINNYTMDDLINFFKLDKTYSIDDLVKKETELATEILSVDNKKYNPKYKFDIVNFIKLAKDVLLNFYNEMENEKEIKRNRDKFLMSRIDPRVGKIINPLSSHQALENTVILDDNINGYEYDVTTAIYVFNTAARNDYFTTESTNCTFDLPTIWNNVISISLVSTIIPNVMYAFNFESGSNQIYIEEDGTGIAGLVTLPEGNYAPYKTPLVNILPITEVSFPDELEKNINSQLGISPKRFKVEVNLATRKTTISNTTNTFRMYILPRIPSDRCSNFSNNIFVDYGFDYVPKKEEVPSYSYLQTMGFLMGYRELEYIGKSSYESEGIFTNIYSDYLYFSLDDYTASQTVSSTYGILGKGGLVDKNILGIIPINSNLFSSTFDNNSNFIYKKREYFGPVDISRITIKLQNQRGNVVNLHETDYNFSIQVKSIYNLNKKSKKGLRTNAFF
jgi:hypothetical protein